MSGLTPEAFTALQECLHTLPADTSFVEVSRDELDAIRAMTPHEQRFVDADGGFRPGLFGWVFKCEE